MKGDLRLLLEQSRHSLTARQVQILGILIEGGFQTVESIQQAPDAQLLQLPTFQESTVRKLRAIIQ